MASISTGHPKLDKLLDGGFPLGRVSTVEGNFQPYFPEHLGGQDGLTRLDAILNNPVYQGLIFFRGDEWGIGIVRSLLEVYGSRIPPRLAVVFLSNPERYLEGLPMILKFTSYVRIRIDTTGRAKIVKNMISPSSGHSVQLTPRGTLPTYDVWARLADEEDL